MGKTISLCGFYGKNNMGDDLMQLALSRILNADGAETIIYSDCSCDGVVNGLDFDTYLDSDLIVIGGGGIITPDFWAFSGGRIDMLAGKNLVFLNVSVYENDLADAGFSQKLKSLYAKAWYVRDSKSQALLRSIGVESVLLGDVIFANQAEHVCDGEDRVLLVYPNYYTFAKHFTLQGNLETSVNYLSYSMMMAKFIDWMVTFGWKVKIVAAQTDRFVDDNIISASIYSYVKSKNDVEWIHTPMLYTEHEQMISNAKLVVSMRYHTSLMAIKHGVACIDIVHHDKNRTLWEDIGFGGSIVDLPLSVDALISAAEYLSNNRQEYLSATTEYVRWAKTSWDFNLNNIKK